jgi:hypothetical protein
VEIVKGGPLAYISYKNDLLSHWSSLERQVKSTKTKFLCINDLMDHTKPESGTNKKELEKFSQIIEYKNNLNFQLLSNQSKKIIDSKEYEEKTNRWENMLKSDIYINESVNVLSNLKTKKIQQNNILAKAG